MEDTNYLPNDYFDRTPSSTTCDYNYYNNYAITTPTLQQQQTHLQQPQTQSNHQQPSQTSSQLQQLQQPSQTQQQQQPSQTQQQQQQTQGTTGLINHHGHHINQQIYHPPQQQQQAQHLQQLHQPATYLEATLQNYGYNQVTGTDIPNSVTISTGNYNNYADCSAATNINTLNYQVVDSILTNQCNDNQYNNNGNYGDSQQLSYGYIDNGLTGVNTNFSTHMPNMKTGQNQLLVVKEERLSIIPASNTSMIISSTKEDSKPVKAIRKKKTNRKKEPNNNKKSASGYAHFFRERQARIKEENKTASFGEISKIVASEWEALSIDEKAVYKRIAENAKNDQFKDIALTHAMTVAGANLSNNNTDNQIVNSKEIPMGQNNVQGNIGSMITYQQSQQQQQQQQQQQAHLIHHTHQQQQHLEANYNHGQINYQVTGGLSYS